MAVAQATTANTDGATQPQEPPENSGGLIAGAFLTVAAYGVVAHHQGMSLGTIPEPWRALFVVTGVAGLTSALGVSLIGGLATSKPAPVRSLRQLRLLFNFNLISYLLMATLALGTKMPSTVMANKGQQVDVLFVGLLLWGLGAVALAVGNTALDCAIGDAQRSSAPSSESTAGPTSNTANEATPSEKDQEKKE